MTDLPFKPKSAEDFERLMKQIWADVCEPDSEGDGLIIYASPWLDQWGNAHRVAKAIGAIRTGATKQPGESEQWTIYRMPDGSRVRIRGSHKTGGDGITQVYSKFVQRD